MVCAQRRSASITVLPCGSRAALWQPCYPVAAMLPCGSPTAFNKVPESGQPSKHRHYPMGCLHIHHTFTPLQTPHAEPRKSARIVWMYGCGKNRGISSCEP
eukprot:359139-Chlamydomonas_euryale.AAC.7